MGLDALLMGLDALFIYGALSIGNIILAIVAAVIAGSLFKISHEKEHLRPWKLLIIIIGLFVLKEVLAAARGFKLWDPGFLTHVTATAMLVLFMSALIWQTNLNEY